MNVIALTVFVSLMLALLFVVLFLEERRHGGFTSAERESLRPLEDEDAKPGGGLGT